MIELEIYDYETQEIKFTLYAEDETQAHLFTTYFSYYISITDGIRIKD